MALAYDATSSFTFDNTSYNSIDWSHTCTGSNRLLFVGVGVVGDTGKVSGITYNSVALTKIWEKVQGGTKNSSGWLLVAPATGSNTVEVTFASSTSTWAGGQGACAVSFNGALQSTTQNTPVTAGNYSGTATVTASTATGEIVVDCVKTGSSVTIGADQTFRETFGNFGCSTQAGSDGGVMSWTLSTQNWAIGAVSIKPAPSWTEIGINFRLTSDYVTDGTDETYCIGDSYPTTRGGVTFGFVSGTVGTFGGRNRSTGVDVRLAGMNYDGNSSTNQAIFRLDLASTGKYEIRLALGDAVYSQAYQYIQLKDDTTAITTIDKSAGSSAGYFYDAEGTSFSAANWPSSNVAIEHTFTSTKLFFVLGAPTAESDVSSIAHLHVKSSAAATGNPWYYYAQQ